RNARFTTSRAILNGGDLSWSKEQGMRPLLVTLLAVLGASACGPLHAQEPFVEEDPFEIRTPVERKAVAQLRDVQHNWIEASEGFDLIGLNLWDRDRPPQGRLATPEDLAWLIPIRTFKILRLPGEVKVSDKWM